MTVTNWIDLAFLVVLVIFAGAFIWNSWIKRDSAKSVKVQKGVTGITIEAQGFPIDEAVDIIKQELTILGFPVVLHTTSGAPE